MRGIGLRLIVALAQQIFREIAECRARPVRAAVSPCIRLSPYLAVGTEKHFRCCCSGRRQAESRATHETSTVRHFGFGVAFMNARKTHGSPGFSVSFCLGYPVSNHRTGRSRFR